MGKVRLAALALSMLLAGRSPGGEDPSAKIEEARIKDRAGKTQEALGILDRLEGPADVRVSYWRATFLKKLGRPNEAADALEAAIAGQESMKKGGGLDRSSLDLEPAMKSLGDDLLQNRRKVRKSLEGYRQKGLPIAWSLIEAKKEAWAVFVLDRLEVMGEPDESIQKLRKSLHTGENEKEDSGEGDEDKQARAVPPPPPPAARDDAESQASLKKNLADAEQFLKTKKYDEAMIAARAALEVDPENPAGLLALGEALARLDRTDQAGEVALRAVEAPKGGQKAGAALQDRAVKLIHGLSPDLEAFLKLRADAVGELVNHWKRVVREKRPQDVEWIRDLALRLAPGEPAVEAMKSTEKAAAAPPGFISLLKPGTRWDWKNKGPGSGLHGEELVFVDSSSGYMNQATPVDYPLGKTFSLRFRLFYDSPPGEDRPIFITFNEDQQAAPRPFALILIPEGKHHVGFARQKGEDRGWSIGEVQDFPKGKPTPKKWFQCELQWEDATKKLRLTVDGEAAFDQKLRKDDVLEGKMAFGSGDKTTFRLRDVFLKTVK